MAFDETNLLYDLSEGRRVRLNADSVAAEFVEDGSDA